MDEIFSWVVLGSDIKAFSFNRVDEAFTLEVARRCVCGLTHRSHPHQICLLFTRHPHAIEIKSPYKLKVLMSQIKQWRVKRFMMGRLTRLHIFEQAAASVL
jgi:hypothetical protein